MSREREAQPPQPPPPAGYVPAEGRGGFSTLNGPYFVKPGEGPKAEQAFYALPRHANGIGIVTLSRICSAVVYTRWSDRM